MQVKTIKDLEAFCQQEKEIYGKVDIILEIISEEMGIKRGGLEYLTNKLSVDLEAKTASIPVQKSYFWEDGFKDVEFPIDLLLVEKDKEKILAKYKNLKEKKEFEDMKKEKEDLKEYEKLKEKFENN